MKPLSLVLLEKKQKINGIKKNDKKRREKGRGGEKFERSSCQLHLRSHQQWVSVGGFGDVAAKSILL